MNALFRQLEQRVIKKLLLRKTLNPSETVVR